MKALLLCLLLVRSLTAEYFETYFVAPPRDAVDDSRNAMRQERYKWPGAVVPYTFDNDYDAIDRQTVIAAMTLIEQETCARFVPLEQHHREHIKFFKSEACGSNIGYRRNRTEPLAVTYSDFCLRLPGAIQHELLHVLGLLHEQSRPDRDEYVRIIWQNIDPRYFSNFKKAGHDVVETFGLPYDFTSLMHYPGNAFAKNSAANVTIVARSDSSMQLGQSDGPTFFDLEKVRRMYKCASVSHPEQSSSP